MFRTTMAVLLLTTAAPALVQAQPAGRAFEMRTYYAAPGKLDALNARFKDHTLALFKKHGMDVVGFWMPTDKEAGAGEKLVYILAHKSRDAAAASWKAFGADPAWVAARTASEVDGRLTTKIETVFLVGTDYSPLK